jgi:hypothetical protein
LPLVRDRISFRTRCYQEKGRASFHCVYQDRNGFERRLVGPVQILDHEKDRILLAGKFNEIDERLMLALLSGMRIHRFIQ